MNTWAMTLTRRAGLLGLAALAGCGGGQSAAGELLPIERLAFVPEGRRALLGGSYWLGAEEALLVGRFEVTRAEWRSWAKQVGAPLPPAPEFGEWEPEDDRLPAAGMDYTEAVAFAAAQGMRLPSVEEWAWCVSGPRGLSYPYGNVAAGSGSNTLEVGLGKPMPPGTFPVGRTAGGISDLFGNMEEWGRWTGETGWVPSRSEHHGSDGLAAWALGGSWRDPSRRLFKLGKNPNLVGRELEPGHRSQSVGLRLMTEARSYLEREAASLSRREWRERMVAVGASWGSPAVGLLGELASVADSPQALQWLLEGARQ